MRSSKPSKRDGEQREVLFGRQLFDHVLVERPAGRRQGNDRDGRATSP